MRWLVLLLIIPLAAAQSPGLVVDPIDVKPGEQMAFSIAFPANATGEAQLAIGDGRTESIHTSIGELDAVFDAPTKGGDYTATLTVQTGEGERIYTADYTVRANNESPLPLLVVLAGILAAFVMRVKSS